MNLKNLFAVAALAIGSFAVATPLAMFGASEALAQQQRKCFPRDAVVSRLAEKYGETRQGAGLTSSGNTVVETFANLETGTWTVTGTDVNGVTCLFASGNAYETITEELPASGDPT